jgi:hypothetical protein
MKIFVIYAALAVALLLTACNGREKEAMAKLANAESMYERNDLIAAKSEIDSLRAWYPTEVKTLRAALELMRRIETKEAERDIAYCDSLLPIKQTELQEAVKGFVFEKEPDYESIGNYTPLQQTVERNVGRSYIRSEANEQGEICLTSVYFGYRPINHTGVKLSVKGGLFAETSSIPYDGGINYRFKDEGNISEIVTYKGEHGIEAIQFISANAKERIKVDYTGGKPFGIYLGDADKKAIIATHRLACILHDVRHLTDERDKAIKKREYFTAKINQ